MKILLLLTDGWGAEGGIARFNANLIEALSASTSVTRIVVLPRFGVIGDALPSKVEQFPSHRRRLRYVLGVLQAVATERFDVIFCGHIFMVPLAALVATMGRIPLWLHVHGTEAWSEPRAIVSKAMHKVQLVTAVSRFTRARLLAWSNIAPELVRILPNTFSRDFRPRPRRMDLVSRYGLNGRKVILTVGRISADEGYKGHDRVISALPGILARVPEAKYLVVGVGDDIPRLRDFAEIAGVASHVIFTGSVPPEEIADHFSLADVFAMPSSGEGFGIVFLEAAASGLPVIGGNCDGSSDALADGYIGTMVDPGNTEALEQAIIAGLNGELLPDPTRVERFARPAFIHHVNELVTNLPRMGIK